jgi:hypothetical protein
MIRADALNITESSLSARKLMHRLEEDEVEKLMTDAESG